MEFTLRFKSYIAHPYWPEADQVVTIQKQSGMNLLRSQDKRNKALSTYLEKIGMTIQEYHKLEELAARPWYTNDEGFIIIPRHQFSGALVQATQSAPSGSRIPAEALRSTLQISDFTTEKTMADQKEFKRYVRPTDGKGKTLSNQRRLTINYYIEDFLAVGDIEFDQRDIKAPNVVALLKYAGKYVGAGASRKMAYGRWEVESPNGQA
jgi:hypothetical protein